MSLKDLVNEEGIDARNCVSWRVPNEVEAPRTPREGAESKSESGTPSSRPASPAKSKSGDSVKSDDSKRESRGNSENDAVSMYWRVLLHNLTYSIDALYYACEEYMDEERCQESFDLLLRSGRDFAMLIERMQHQRMYEMHFTGGVSWEVRKPSHTYLNEHAYQGYYTQNGDEKISKLRPTAAPFVPKTTTSTMTGTQTKDSEDILEDEMTEDDDNRQNADDDSDDNGHESLSKRKEPLNNGGAGKGAPISARVDRVELALPAEQVERTQARKVRVEHSDEQVSPRSWSPSHKTLSPRKILLKDSTQNSQFVQLPTAKSGSMTGIDQSANGHGGHGGNGEHDQRLGTSGIASGASGSGEKRRLKEKELVSSRRSSVSYRTDTISSSRRQSDALSNANISTNSRNSNPKPFVFATKSSARKEMKAENKSDSRPRAISTPSASITARPDDSSCRKNTSTAKDCRIDVDKIVMKSSKSSVGNEATEKRSLDPGDDGDHSALDDDESVHQEVAEASEAVWAEAEAWIEAEAAVEEAAWEVMLLRKKQKSPEEDLDGIEKVDDYSDDRSDYDDIDIRIEVDTDDAWTEVCSDGRQSPVPDISFRGEKKQTDELNSRDESIDISEKKSCFVNEMVHSEDAKGVGGQIELHDEPPSSGSAEKKPSLGTQALRKHATTSALLPTSHVAVPSRSPQPNPPSNTRLHQRRSSSTSKRDLYVNAQAAQTGAVWEAALERVRYATSPAYLTNRSLHAKLASPDRVPLRNASPSEIRRKTEFRQSNAEANRDIYVAERRARARIASEKVKLISEREAIRLAQVEQALEDRLKDAEKRHSLYLKSIKGRAGNENLKVSEVMFINNLNEESLAEQLQQKLEEVEARILAAAQRRSDRLTEISISQRKRNNRKTQQMSDLRLQLERERMERWEKLQSRLEAVQGRREARLAEMSKPIKAGAVEANELENESKGSDEKKHLSSSDTPKNATRSGAVSSTTKKNDVSSGMPGTQKILFDHVEEAVELHTPVKAFDDPDSSAKSSPRGKCKVGPGKKSKSKSSKKKMEDMETAYLDSVIAENQQNNREQSVDGSPEKANESLVSSCYRSLYSIVKKKGTLAARQAALQKQENSTVKHLETDGKEKRRDLRCELESLINFIQEKMHTSSIGGSQTASRALWQDTLQSRLRAKEKENRSGASAGNKGQKVSSKSGASATAGEPSAAAMRAVWSKTAGLLRTLNLHKKKIVEEFVQIGGMRILQILYDPTEGVVSSAEAVDLALQVGLINALARATQACAVTASARDLILSTGCAVSILDTAHTLLLMLDSRASGSSSSFTNTPIGSPVKQSSNGKSQGRQSDDINIDVTLQSVTAALSLLSGTMNLLLRHMSTKAQPFPSSVSESAAEPLSQPSSAPAAPETVSTADPVIAENSMDSKSTAIISDASRSRSHSPSSCDKNAQAAVWSDGQSMWVWYLFSCGFVRRAIDFLKSSNEADAALVRRDSTGEIPSTQTSTNANIQEVLTSTVIEFLGGIAAYLRLSAGISSFTVVHSVMQLRSRRHLHARGREMISVLKMAHLVPVLCSFIGVGSEQTSGGVYVTANNGTAPTSSSTTSPQAAGDTKTANEMIIEAWDEVQDPASLPPLTSTQVNISSLAMECLSSLCLADLDLLQQQPPEVLHALLFRLGALLRSLLGSTTFSPPTSNGSSTISTSASRIKDGKTSAGLSVTDVDACLHKLFAILNFLYLPSHLRLQQTPIARGANMTLLSNASATARSSLFMFDHMESSVMASLFLSLCRLPIRFFSEERMKMHLMPTLTAMLLRDKLLRWRVSGEGRCGGAVRGGDPDARSGDDGHQESPPSESSLMQKMLLELSPSAVTAFLAPLLEMLQKQNAIATDTATQTSATSGMPTQSLADINHEGTSDRKEHTLTRTHSDELSVTSVSSLVSIASTESTINPHMNKSLSGARTEKMRLSLISHRLPTEFWEPAIDYLSN